MIDNHEMTWKRGVSMCNKEASIYATDNAKATETDSDFGSDDENDTEMEEPDLSETKERGATVERNINGFNVVIVLADEVVTGRKAYSVMAGMETAQLSFHVLKIELDSFQLQNERGLLYLYKSATIVKFVDCLGGWIHYDGFVGFVG